MGKNQTSFKKGHQYLFKPGNTLGKGYGRPRKVVSQLLKEYAAAGIERVTPTDVAESLERVMNFSNDDLKKLSLDKKAPIILTILSRELLKARNGLRAAEFVLDRLHLASKNVQQVDATVTHFTLPDNGRNQNLAKKHNVLKDESDKS